MRTTDFFCINVNFVCLLMQYNRNICYTMTLILVYLENLVRLVRKPSIFIRFSDQVAYFLFTEDRIQIVTFYSSNWPDLIAKKNNDMIFKHKAKCNIDHWVNFFRSKLQCGYGFAFCRSGFTLMVSGSALIARSGSGSATMIIKACPDFCVLDVLHGRGEGAPLPTVHYLLLQPVKGNCH